MSKKFVILLLAAGLCACVPVYKAPILAPQKLATLYCQKPTWQLAVFIDRIDGQAPSTLAATHATIFLGPINISAGTHKVRIGERIGPSSTKPDSQIDTLLYAEAGHTYQIKGEIQNSNSTPVRAWIVDDATGATVTSIVGTDDQSKPNTP